VQIRDEDGFVLTLLYVPGGQVKGKIVPKGQVSLSTQSLCVVC